MPTETYFRFKFSTRSVDTQLYFFSQRENSLPGQQRREPLLTKKAPLLLTPQQQTNAIPIGVEANAVIRHDGQFMQIRHHGRHAYRDISTKNSHGGSH